MTGSHPRKRGFHARLHFMCWYRHIDGAECHIVKYSGHEQLVIGVLENHSHSAPNFGHSCGGYRNISDSHLTNSGSQYPIEMEQESRFASAVATNDANALSWAHAKAHTLQGPVSIRIGERQLARLQLMVTQVTRPIKIAPNRCERSKWRAPAKHTQHPARNIESVARHCSTRLERISPLNPLDIMAW